MMAEPMVEEPMVEGRRAPRWVPWIGFGTIVALAGWWWAASVAQGDFSGSPTLPAAAALGAIGMLAAVAAGMVLYGNDRAARDATGPGEGAEAARRRQFWTIVGVLFAAGGVVGFVSALAGNPTSALSGPASSWLALAAAAVTGIAIIGGAWLLNRRIDELERADNMWGAAIGGNMLLVAYPVWFLLWKGGWVSEPGHDLMFAALFAVTMLAYLYRKLR